MSVVVFRQLQYNNTVPTWGIHIFIYLWLPILYCSAKKFSYSLSFHLSSLLHVPSMFFFSRALDALTMNNFQRTYVYVYIIFNGISRRTAELMILFRCCSCNAYYFRLVYENAPPPPPRLYLDWKTLIKHH